MSVARVAIFDDPVLHDDERRSALLRDLVRAQPGFLGGYHLKEDGTGRLMSITVWDSDAAMEAGEQAVARRPVEDQRGIRPSRVERWVVEGTF
jgi:heme-degrading monooxygenase HmoA